MECVNLKRIVHSHDTRHGVVKAEYFVPCGKCVWCGVARRSEWSTRLFWESRKHYGSRFITLTYSEKYCPLKVRKSHVQNFFKRLRKAGAKFKYYAVGEYGGLNGRPHYHIIMFGEVSERAIRQAWSFYNRSTKWFDSIGIVHIGAITEASVMYALGYTVHGEKVKVNRPFTLMSKGLGKSYLTPAVVAWHKADWKNYTMVYDEKRRLPRYYKLKIFTPRERLFMRLRDAKASWQKEVDWIRKMAKTSIKDPLAYRDEQRLRAAQSIRMKCKSNLSI